jgi:hypothetical protein
LRIVLAGVAFIGFSSIAHAQSPAGMSKAQLFQTMSALDTKLFDAANRCDYATLSSLVADDLEFYHDKSGLAVGKQVFLDAIKNNTCGKMIRELVPGSLEVYPIGDYGAIEVGVHLFHHPGHDNDTPVGKAKFLQVWQYKDGAWRLTRVISYDHQ